MMLGSYNQASNFGAEMINRQVDRALNRRVNRSNRLQHAYLYFHAALIEFSIIQVSHSLQAVGEIRQITCSKGNLYVRA